MNIKNLLTSQYLFQVNPAMFSVSDKLFLAIGAFSIVLAAVIKFAAMRAPNPIDKQYREKFFKLFLTVGLWEVMWFMFRYENIRFFGSHFVALLGLLMGLVWLVVIGTGFVKGYTTQKQEWEKEQLKLKYLPK